MPQPAAGLAELSTPLDALPVLVVEVAGHRCAVPAEAVIEVHPAVHLTGLPDAPDVVVGLLNRRGDVVPVLSLRRRLGLPPRALQLDDHLVVVQLPERRVGLLVDGALDVTTVAHVDETATARAAHSRGVAVLPDGLVVVVDLPSFLSAAEDVALDLSLAARSA